jgi:hypothetical protein
MKMSQNNFEFMARDSFGGKNEGFSNINKRTDRSRGEKA